jgi:hypothetical protein
MLNVRMLATRRLARNDSGGIEGIMSSRPTSGLEQLPVGRDLGGMTSHSSCLLITVSHPVHKMGG